MWEKVIFNLLSNALKFTLSGEIAVTVRPVGSTVEVEVRDTGSGIPEQELPYLFTRFHRVRGTEARTHEGTGIGLALVHDLVRLHGGTVNVSSAVGAGTSFVVALPLGRKHLPADHVPVSSGIGHVEVDPYLAETGQWLQEEAQSQSEASPLPAWETGGSGDESVAAVNVPMARIVLADDNADMRDYLRRLLRPRYAVEAVPDGEAALAAVRAQRPDLVLADIMMPRMDGLELLRALRADPETASIPIVLLSARAGEEASVEGLEAGADDYLIKPFSARELLARVKVHVDMARAREQLEREKEEFISLAAHDLKNPLAAIKGFAQVLQRQLNREGALAPDRAAFALHNIERTATRLNALIVELQDVTMIQAGQPLPLQKASLDLAHLVREVVEQQRQTHTSHQLDLSLPTEPLMLVGDAPRLERVLSNLLSNATKYSPVDTTIRVALSKDGEGSGARAVLTVMDEGIGIPSSDIARIFDRFSRGSNVMSDIPGSGIGLASVRQIVEQHEGTVTVESDEGKGSTFTLRLPLLLSIT
jgi:signal transduction histidine kinase